MNRRNTASGAIIFAFTLTLLTTLATVLLTFYGAEQEHYGALALGVILSVVWGLISMALGTAAGMSLRDEIEYETLVDASLNSNDIIQEEEEV